MGTTCLELRFSKSCAKEEIVWLVKSFASRTTLQVSRCTKIPRASQLVTQSSRQDFRLHLSLVQESLTESMMEFSDHSSASRNLLTVCTSHVVLNAQIWIVIASGLSLLRTSRSAIWSLV